MIKRILRIYYNNTEKIRYLIVGGWNTLFGYFTYYLLFTTLGGYIHYVVLLIPSNIIAIINAFFCYKYLVFKTKGNTFIEYLKFNAVYGAALLLNFVLMPFLVEIINLHPLVAQALTVFITIVLSYLGHKLFTFKRINV